MRPYNQVVIFFALTQLLGIYTGIALIHSAMQIPEVREMSVAPTGSPDDPLNAAFFIAYIIFGAAMIILVARFYKGAMLFRFLELAVITSASAIVFFAIFLNVLGLDFEIALLLGGLVGLALGAAKFFFPQIKNAAAIISSAGVGALFGFSLGFLPTAIFIIGLSAYDYIAVFKTRHMVEMARELSTRQLSFAVTAKNIPQKKPKEKQVEYIERVKTEGERLDLGTGDLSVPAMISVSAYSLGPNGIIYSFAAAIGATVSLYFLLKFVSRQKVFLPALPPICLGSMLALLIAKLLYP